jgi:hypothetical protein
MLLGIAVTLGALIVVGMIGAVSQRAVFPALGLLYLLAIPVIVWGFFRFLLKAIDGRARVRDALAIFERFGSRFAKAGLLVLIWIVMSVPGSLPQFLLQIQGTTDPLRLGAAVLWSLAWSLAVTIRFTFSFFFMVDGEMGAIDALRSSWDRMRGNVLRVIVLWMISLVIVFVSAVPGLIVVRLASIASGMLVMYVGLIPATLLVSLVYPSAFRQMVGRLGPATATRVA